jgi:hypothetical protein
MQRKNEKVRKDRDMRNIDTLNDIEGRFNQFSKWETYGAAFSSMDNGRIRLRDIIAIAGVYGISESVIRMRRRDWIAMRGGK